MANVERLARELHDAEAHLRHARFMLDGALWRAHEEATLSVASLARAATLSRESIYQAMDRARSRHLERG